jgi:hypothetical protein
LQHEWKVPKLHEEAARAAAAGDPHTLEPVIRVLTEFSQP